MDNKEDIIQALKDWFDGQDKWKTKKELAAELGLSHSTVRKYFSEGRIPRKAENREKLLQLTGLPCFESDGAAAQDPVLSESQVIKPESEIDVNRPRSSGIQSLLNHILKTISEDVSERIKIRSFVQSLSRAWERGDLDTVSWFVRKDIAEAMPRYYPEAKGLLEEIKSSLEGHGRLEIDELELMLEHYCDEKGIKLNGGSPTFVVDHFIHIVFDRKRNTVKVGLLLLQNPEWAEVAQSIEKEHKRIWGRDFDFLEFYEELLLSYENVIKYQTYDTDWVGLMDIYGEIKKQSLEGNIRGRSAGYPKEEFSADLSKLWWAQANGLHPDLRIEFSTNRDPRFCFAVILPDETTALYGFMRPKKT
jgi:hypothetical protein